VSFRTYAILALSLALTACQSQHRAYTIVCNAPIDCTDCNSGSAAERQEKVSVYISERLRNREVKELFERIATADPATSQKSLEQAILAAGVESCPFTESSVTTELPELKLPQNTR
jgi:hypothetical protein